MDVGRWDAHLSLSLSTLTLSHFTVQPPFSTAITRILGFDLHSSPLSVNTKHPTGVSSTHELSDRLTVSRAREQRVATLRVAPLAEARAVLPDMVEIAWLGASTPKLCVPLGIHVSRASCCWSAYAVGSPSRGAKAGGRKRTNVSHDVFCFVITLYLVEWFTPCCCSCLAAGHGSEMPSTQHAMAARRPMARGTCRSEAGLCSAVPMQLLSSIGMKRRWQSLRMLAHRGAVHLLSRLPAACARCRSA